MGLTEKDKQRIEEEEAYRRQIREEQKYQSNSNKKKSKKGLLLAIFAGLVILVLLILPSSSHYEGSNVVSTGSDVSGPKKQTASVKSGINVSRDIFITALEREGYNFNEDSMLNGEENYIASKGKGEVQLLGSEGNLSSASFTAYMGFDANGTVDSSVTAQSEMMLFASTIDNECSSWLMQRLKEALANKESVYNKTGVYCDRKLTLYYFPGDSMTFGVEPEE